MLMKELIGRVAGVGNKNIKKECWINVILGITLFVFSAAIIIFRNLDPLLYPTIYAEDGKWAGAVLIDGTAKTAFHIREFPVLGLVGMLRVGLIAVEIFARGDLSSLPVAYFFISTVFLATTATLAFYVFRGEMSLVGRIALWVAVVLMPVGDDANEIFGRILNLGFVFPVLQYLFLTKCIRAPAKLPWFAVALLFSLIAGWTFPVCIGVSGAAMLVFYFCGRSRELDGRPFKDVAAALLAVIILNISFLSIDSFLSKGGANLPFSEKGLIEFLFGRALLYPMLAAWYASLTNEVVVTLALSALILIAVGAAVAIRFSAQRAQVVLLLLVFVGYYLATVVMRVGFTSIYGEYKTTFPDRYYYGLNILIVFVVTLVSECCWRLVKSRYQALRWFLRGVPILVIVTMLAALPRQFEMAEPKMRWGGVGTFEYSLCALVWGKGPLPYNANATQIDLPVYPLWPGYAWRMTIPIERLYRFDMARCAPVFADDAKQPRQP